MLVLPPSPSPSLALPTPLHYHLLSVFSPLPFYSCFYKLVVNPPTPLPSIHYLTSLFPLGIPSLLLPSLPPKPCNPPSILQSLEAPSQRFNQWFLGAELLYDSLLSVRPSVSPSVCQSVRTENFTCNSKLFEISSQKFAGYSLIKSTMIFEITFDLRGQNRPLRPT